MRCKKGDLAVYVGEDLSQRGSVVRCISLHPASFALGIPGWIVDPPMHNHLTGVIAIAVRDSALTPIRDQPGPDETLAWKPVPSTINRTDDDLVSGLWEVLAGDGPA